MWSNIERMVSLITAGHRGEDGANGHDGFDGSFGGSSGILWCYYRLYQFKFCSDNYECNFLTFNLGTDGSNGGDGQVKPTSTLRTRRTTILMECISW